MSLKNGHCPICGKEATMKCSRCYCVFYCGKQHQTADWPKHRTYCRACQVLFHPKVGYFLAASRDIKEGEVILSETPFVVGPAHFLRSPCCIGCSRSLKETVAAACPGCKWPACSDSCPALKHPAGHAAECAAFKPLMSGANDSPSWRVVLPFRCLLLQKRNPKLWKWLLVNVPYAEAKCIVKSAHSTKAVLVHNFARTSNIDQNVLPKEFSVETVKQLCTVIDVYALYFSTSSSELDVAALYETAGYLQVSCTPNTRTTIVKISELTADAEKELKIGRVVVRALHDISKGEILSYSYTYPLRPTTKRQLDLFTTRNMLCTCKRCLDPRELGSNIGTLKCTKCPGWVLPEDTSVILNCDWKCDENCGEKLSIEEASDRVSKYAKMCQDISQCNMIGRMEPQSLESMLARMETELHPNHEMCLILKKVLIDTYFDLPFIGRSKRKLTDRELERKADLGRELVSAIDHLSPFLCKGEYTFAEFIWAWATSKSDLTKQKFASGNWTQDRAIRNVVKIRALLQRASTLYNMSDSLFEGCTKAIKGILTFESDILTWAKTNGLEIPENDQSS